MVLAYLPQRMKRSLVTNSNYPPQGDGAGAPPLGLIALVQTGTLNAIVQTTTLDALVKTGGTP